MTRKIPLFRKGLLCTGLVAATTMAALLGAQTPQPRIQASVSPAQTTPLRNSLHPLAQERFDAGAMPTGARIGGMTIAFARSAAQQAALNKLIADQQNPASPLYHKWLTPDQFAARFGMAQSDLEKVQGWLQQQGFTVNSVARSHNSIRFSGTVGQVNAAFGTQMHYYNALGAKHFAPSTALSVPSALAGVVAAIGNLNDFRPRSMRVPRPAFTSGVSGTPFFAPGDIKTAYNVGPLTTGGIDGTGQSITVVGQTAISTSDIQNFQSASGLAVKLPAQILVPGSGSSVTFQGDEGESDLDLEWSSAMAPGATINFVYTGSDTNYSVFDAVNYAVDQRIGNIISVSYGACESVLGGYDTFFEPILQQAITQGQTVLVASGDSGSSACNGLSGLSVTAQEVLDVSYPASSPNVTAVGGTEVSQSNSAFITSGNAYWTGASTADVLTSALQYLPEVAWNDEVYINAHGGSGLSASGGGVSTLFNKPSWQASVPGIPADGKRDVPDVSLYSSPIFVGYLYCTSDQSDWQQGQGGSCGSGFRGSGTDTSLTVAGGTSFATPIFAGMVALLNQKQGYTSGQGLINPTLYTLASNSATYGTVFHDVTSGNNECLAGASFCDTTSGTTTKYVAGAGYDQVTGLGSVNLGALATAWPANTTMDPGLVATSTSLTASNTSPDLNSPDNINISVQPVTGAAATGTVNLSIDQTLSSTGTLTGGTTSTVTLDGSGAATYAATFSTWGSHLVVAQYAGDGAHAASTGSISFNIIPFTLAASPNTITAAQNNHGTSVITILSQHSYAGTVQFQLSTTDANLANNGCYAFSPSAGSAVTANGTATSTLTIYTSTGACSAIGASTHTSHPQLVKSLPGHIASSGASPMSRFLPAGAVLAGLFLFGIRKRSARVLSMIAFIFFAGFLGMSMMGCGGGGSSTGGGGSGGNSTNVPAGSYALALTGTDSVDSSATYSIPITLTVN